jgi:multidrug resistance efflux pump
VQVLDRVELPSAAAGGRVRTHGAFHAVIGALLLLPPIALALVFARVDESVTARGRLEFARQTPVTTRVSARIEAVAVREGQAVRRGELLARLDDHELRLGRARLGERLHGLTVELVLLDALRLLAVSLAHPRDASRARQELRVRLADEALRTEQLRARRVLLERAVVSSEEVAIALREQAAAAARRGAEQAGMGALAARQARERLELERDRTEVLTELALVRAELPLAERALAEIEVRAPIDGVVLTRNPERLIGRLAAAGAPILELADGRDLELVLTVDERDIARVAAGQEVVVSLDAFPFYLYRRFTGTVRDVGRAFTDDGRAEFRVFAALPPPALDLHVGGERRLVELGAGLAGEGRIVVDRSIPLGAYLFRSLQRRAPAGFTLR